MLIIDNDHSYFFDFVKNKVIGSAWEVLCEEHSYLTPSFREEKSALGEHLERYGGMPKLKGDLFVLVLRRK